MADVIDIKTGDELVDEKLGWSFAKVVAIIGGQQRTLHCVEQLQRLGEDIQAIASPDAPKAGELAAEIRATLASLVEVADHLTKITLVLSSVPEFPDDEGGDASA